MTAVCDDCEDFEKPFIDYTWALFEMNNGTYEPVEDIENKSPTGTCSISFVYSGTHWFGITFGLDFP